MIYRMISEILRLASKETVGSENRRKMTIDYCNQNTYFLRGSPFRQPILKREIQSGRNYLQNADLISIHAHEASIKTTATLP